MSVSARENRCPKAWGLLLRRRFVQENLPERSWRGQEEQEEEGEVGFNLLKS